MTTLETILSGLAKSPFAAEVSAKLKTATGAEREAFVSCLISMSIKALVDAGMPLRDAFDATLGEGRYQQLSDEVWERCRAMAT